MDYETIILEKKDNIAVITMNNPKSLNAISGKTGDELNDAIDNITNDNCIRVAIITGSGKAFVAGADIDFMKSMNPNQAIQFSYNIQNLYKKIEQSSKPFIAAINGFALGGGCELAIACDIRLASVNAKLGLPETSLGIIPGSGGTQRMPQLIGIAKAKELIFTGAIINAEEAHAIGLVNKIVPNETLMEEAYKMAEQIIKNAPIAIAYAKQCINVSAQTSLDNGLEYEKNMFGLCFSTLDQKTGMTAFVTKTKAEFKGE